MLCDQCWQFFYYVVMYVEMFCIWCLCGIDVEVCVFVEFLVVGGVFDVGVVWVGVGYYQYQVEL